ncbi:MAG: hypothetical protein IJ315_05295 [Firmicutes bacterium]|nr:hypothetical protein [Bacillota bacterium]
MDFSDVPVGFGMALAQNTPALERFGQMLEEERQAVLMQAQNARSEEQMRRIVSGIAGNAE